MKAGQIIGETLKLYGIEYIFGLSGGDHPMWLGLRDSGVKYILSHNERSSIAMADAYSRITGKPSIAYGQWGPGAALCVSGLADAYWAQSPVICINSDTPSSGVYRHCYQEISNQGNMFSDITKWNAKIPNINRLPDMLRTAIRVAVSGVPGPVHLDIPRELTRDWSDDIDVQLYAEPECKKTPAYRSSPMINDIKNVVSIISKAKRPLILAGGGVIISEAWNELIKFAEMLNIPVVTSGSGKASIPSSHPLAVGVAGYYSGKCVNDIVSKCDTYIVFGSNLGDMTTQGWKIPSSNTKVIQIDLNPNVLGANVKTEYSLAADAKFTLIAMMEVAAAIGLSKKECKWINWVQDTKLEVNSWKNAFQELTKKTVSPDTVNPYYVLDTLNRTLSKNDILVADTGYMAAYGAALMDIKTPGKSFLRAVGSLGYGFPLSLGAKIALGDKGRVFCLMGDGGMGYHVSDIETALRCNLPVIVLVLNNSQLAFTAHTLKFKYKESMPSLTQYLDIDYGAVARAFGAYGEKVTSNGNLEAALHRALDANKIAVIDISIDKEMPGPVTYFDEFINRTV